MLAKTGNSEITLPPDTDEILEEMAKELKYEKKATLIREIARDNLDHKALDYYDHTVRNRELRKQGIKKARFFMTWPSKDLREAILESAEKSRTFFSDWIEDLLIQKANEYKESKHVVESRNR